MSIYENPLTHLTGTKDGSGDNTLIAAQGTGNKIIITKIILQNESTTATTMILKNGSDELLRVLGQNQGDGIALTLDEDNYIVLSDDTALILNLSGANSCGYSISYYIK